MPPLTWIVAPGELAVEVDVHRAREVPFEVGRTPLWYIEPPPHVEQPNGAVLAQQVRKLERGDQRGGHVFMLTPSAPPPRGVTTYAATLRHTP